LAGTGAKDHPEAVHVVPRRRKVHHFYGAAGQAKGQRPD